jgi:hypothetical protein
LDDTLAAIRERASLNPTEQNTGPRRTPEWTDERGPANLSMLKVDGQWCIVHKTFYEHPAR